MAKLNPELKAWLNNKFLDWQKIKGERKTISEFARYLDISQPVLSHYLNGTHLPSGDNVDKIAHRFGVEIYDLLGLPHPDQQLQLINRIWQLIPPEQQLQLRQQAEIYAEKNAEKHHTNEPHTT